MGIFLSKDEKYYINSNHFSSYLLIKHKMISSVDKFKVLDEKGQNLYSISINGRYRKKTKKSPTLIVEDKSGKIVGKMNWNTESISISPINAYILGLEFVINYKTEPTGKWFFRNSYYEANSYAWVMDNKTINDANGKKCAEINTIYRSGNKQDSYLISRRYDPKYTDGDILALLFWAIDYICNDYEECYRKTIVGRINSFLDDRENEIHRNQEQSKGELENRAESYIREKEEKYSEKDRSLSGKQKIFRIIIKVLICLLVPILGSYIISLIPYSVVPYRFNLINVIVVLFIISVLGVNYRNPNRVLFYEWLGLIVLLIIGLISGTILGNFAEKGLQSIGIQGIGIEFPLCIFLLSSIVKWKSRHIESLVKLIPLFTTIQSTAFGFIVGRLLIVFIDQTGRLSIVLGSVLILLVLLLSKCRIMVRTLVKCIIGGCSLGILLEGIMKVL